MKFYGQWQPPVDEVLWRNYFAHRGTQKGTLVECGAADGLLGACGLFFEESLQWRAINVEPSPVLFGALQRFRPKSLNLQCALSPENPVILHDVMVPVHHNGSGESSIRYNPIQAENLASRGIGTYPVQVEGITYTQLLERANISSLDLMILDVEGYELDVLAMMEGAPVLPDVMCIEYPMLNFEHLVEACKKLGLRYDFASFNNAFFSKLGPYTAYPIGRTEIMSVEQLNNLQH